MLAPGWPVYAGSTVQYTIHCKPTKAFTWQITIHLMQWFLVNSHQQTRERVTMYLVVIWTKMMTNFWNMNSASAPIHITDTSVRYWIRADMATQTPYTSDRSTPTTNAISMSPMAAQSWMWSLLTSRLRSRLQGFEVSKIVWIAAACGGNLGIWNVQYYSGHSTIRLNLLSSVQNCIAWRRAPDWNVARYKCCWPMQTVATIPIHCVGPPIVNTPYPYMVQTSMHGSTTANIPLMPAMYSLEHKKSDDCGSDPDQGQADSNISDRFQS